METVWVIPAITLAGAGFMLWFLIALLRESPPSVCYWVAQVPGKREKGKDLAGLRRSYLDENCRATEANRSECYRQLLENENHETEKCKSGLITVDVRAISDGLGWRAIHPKHSYSFRELRHY
jgi:hypothetical protein